MKDEPTLTWQVRLNPRTVAEIVRWAASQGAPIVSRSGVLRIALETFAEALRLSGRVEPVESHTEALEVFMQYGLTANSLKELSKAGRVGAFTKALEFEEGFKHKREINQPSYRGKQPTPEELKKAADDLNFRQFNAVRQEDNGLEPLTWEQYQLAVKEGLDIATVRFAPVEPDEEPADLKAAHLAALRELQEA